MDTNIPFWGRIRAEVIPPPRLDSYITIRSNTSEFRTLKKCCLWGKNFQSFNKNLRKPIMSISGFFSWNSDAHLKFQDIHMTFYQVLWMRCSNNAETCGTLYMCLVPTCLHHEFSKRKTSRHVQIGLRKNLFHKVEPGINIINIEIWNRIFTYLWLKGVHGVKEAKKETKTSLAVPGRSPPSETLPYVQGSGVVGRRASLCQKHPTWQSGPWHCTPHIPVLSRFKLRGTPKCGNTNGQQSTRAMRPDATVVYILFTFC